MNKKVIIKKIMIGGISALLAASGPLAGAMPIVEAAEQAQDINAVISLHLNGGTLPEDTNLIFDSRTDTVLPIPIRLGYQFAGWYSNENFSGTATAVLPAGSAQNSTTYYAKWEPMVYTIGFETYGGSIAGEVPKQPERNYSFLIKLQKKTVILLDGTIIRNSLVNHSLPLRSPIPETGYFTLNGK
jgi:uncharacterized repeat protein (TIGR02543 family)